MKNKKLIQAAVLSYVTEMKKISMRTKYILENNSLFRVKNSLFENSEDVSLYHNILLEGIMDKIKGFFSGGKKSLLTQDEKAVVDVFKEKLSSGMKKVSDLSKVTVEDPTKLGISLEQMVEVAEDVKKASDVFEKMVDEADSGMQEELMAVVPELMKAKMGLFGMVAFRLSEIRKEATDALQSLVSFIPSGQLNYALKLAKDGYKPELPMRSAMDIATGRDLPDATMPIQSAPLGFRVTEEVEASWEDAKIEEE